MAWIANSLPLVKTYVTLCFMSQFPTVSSRNIVSITDSDSKKEKKKMNGEKNTSHCFFPLEISPLPTKETPLLFAPILKKRSLF